VSCAACECDGHGVRRDARALIRLACDVLGMDSMLMSDVMSRALEGGELLFE
jgi:hypothetical protein